MASAEVAAHFQRRGIKVLVGDWTRGDAAIGRFLEAQGRSGVPLYLYYAPGRPQPQVLPQLLTAGGSRALKRDTYLSVKRYVSHHRAGAVSRDHTRRPPT